MFARLFDSPWSIVVIVLVIVLLFGWKRLPDAARSLGRSMRIFKSEVQQMGDKDDNPSAASQDTVRGERTPEQRAAENRAAENRAAEHHAAQPRPTDGPADGQAPRGDDPHRS